MTDHLSFVCTVQWCAYGVLCFFRKMEQNENFEQYAVKVIYADNEKYIYFDELSAECFLKACK